MSYLYICLTYRLRGRKDTDERGKKSLSSGEEGFAGRKGFLDGAWRARSLEIDPSSEEGRLLTFIGYSDERAGEEEQVRVQPTPERLAEEKTFRGG